MNDEMHERIQARWLASRLLHIDPDGNNSVLARQYMRALDKIERLTKIIGRDPRLGAVDELADKWPAPERGEGW
jgi:hypothetical protein